MRRKVGTILYFLKYKFFFLEIKIFQERNSTETDKETRDINKKMITQLLWLNFFFGIIFILVIYFILLEKRGTVLLRDSYVPFFTTIFFTLFFLGYHYYAEKKIKNWKN